MMKPISPKATEDCPKNINVTKISTNTRYLVRSWKSNRSRCKEMLSKKTMNLV